MPDWSGKVEDYREGIMLYLRGTSLDNITACFCDNQQKWLDRVNHLGRFSVVGTYFHGNLSSAQLTIRALAIGYIFCHFAKK
jgi:hypothetical protein